MRTKLTSLLAGIAMLGPAAGSVAHAQEVKLGAFVTLSGISADVGAQMKAGIEVAVERIAPGFTINGVATPIRVIWYDDEGRGDTGLNVVTGALTVDKITCPYHLSHPCILMMETAEKRDGHDCSGRLHRVAERGVLS